MQRVRQSGLLAWYGGLLAGILPVLVLGFLWSALADRLVFAGWALALAAVYAVALRQGLAAGWPAARLSGVLALLLAAGAALFARLEALHHEVLDLGSRAVLEGLYSPAATSPRTAAVAAAAFAVAGLAALAAAAGRRAPGGAGGSGGGGGRMRERGQEKGREREQERRNR